MVGSRVFSVAAPRLWNVLPLGNCSAKTQISFRKKSKTYFLDKLFRLKSSVVRLAQTTIEKFFGTMGQIAITLVAPLSSDHRGYRRLSLLLLSLLLLLLLLLLVAQRIGCKYEEQIQNYSMIYTYVLLAPTTARFNMDNGLVDVTARPNDPPIKPGLYFFNKSET